MIGASTWESDSPYHDNKVRMPRTPMDYGFKVFYFAGSNVYYGDRQRLVLGLGSKPSGRK